MAVERRSPGQHPPDASLQVPLEPQGPSVTRNRRVSRSQGSSVTEFRYAKNRRKDLPDDEAIEVMHSLVDIVRAAGEEIMATSIVIRDEGIRSNHEQSSVDTYARGVVDNLLNLKLPHIDGVRRFELDPYERRLLIGSEQGQVKGYYVIDEIDGTTNTKRALASSFEYRPQAAVSIAFSPTEQIGDIQTAALYLIHDKETFSALRMGDRYVAFREEQLIRPEEVKAKRGDDNFRVLVVGYSNTHRHEKAEVEDALVQQAGFRIYDGSRSSSVDIINVVRGQFDAYIDLRAVWGGDSRKDQRL